MWSIALCIGISISSFIIVVIVGFFNRGSSFSQSLVGRLLVAGICVSRLFGLGICVSLCWARRLLSRSLSVGQSQKAEDCQNQSLRLHSSTVISSSKRLITQML